MQRGMLGGWLFKSGFPGAHPLAFQEVDTGMKDRRENPLFFLAQYLLSG